MSLNEFNSYLLNQTLGIVLYPLCMLPMVGLHMFYSMLIILMPVNKYHYGTHAHLSSWYL
jgi:hypothetical protein